MIEYTQRLLHDPANGITGDCWRTAIGCLLHTHPDVIPHFVGNDRKWWEDTQAWLKTQGYALYEICGHFDQVGHLGVTDCHHLITGLSPRDPANVRHTVVGRDGVVVWDPHPSRAGILGDPSTWYLSFLIKL